MPAASNWRTASSRNTARKLKDLDARLEQTLRANEKRWEGVVDQLRAQLEAAKGPKASKGLERKMAALKREVREEWNAQVLEAIGGAAPATVRNPPRTGRLPWATRCKWPTYPPRQRSWRFPMMNRSKLPSGHLHMRLQRSEVRRIVHGGTGAARPAVAARRGDEAPAEINVIGETAEMACETCR